MVLRLALKSPILQVATKKAPLNSLHDAQKKIPLERSSRRPEEKIPLRYLYVAQKKRYHYCMQRIRCLPHCEDCTEPHTTP